MITLFVGHRGVGKSSLLKRVQNYYNQAGLVSPLFFDLDEEVEKDEGLSISNIFETKGERHFRDLESKVLSRLCNENDQYSGEVFISLGAGYKGSIPPKTFVIWIRRSTDELGRIFFDRPRLTQSLSLKEEFLSLKQGRDKKYQEQSHMQLILCEGQFEFDSGEFQFFTKNRTPLSGQLTALPDWKIEFKNSVFFETLSFLQIELRDDLLSQNKIEEYSTLFPLEKKLYSYRQKKSLNNGEICPRNYSSIDWPLELGEPKTEFNILSCHEFLKNENLSQFLERLENSAHKATNQVILKAAPLVKSFADLYTGYLWQQKDPEHRSFLPRSIDGRWKWFRLLMKDRMPLNFWRLDEGSALDQPTLLEWLGHNSDAPKKEFAAILGSPITHSYTPTEQRSFFESYGLPIVAIDIKESEFTDGLEILQKIGLKAAAVTSPLKKKAFTACSGLTEEAKSLESVNTLFFDTRKNSLLGHNTDIDGFREAFEHAQVSGPFVIWGGLGTLPVLKKTIPDAVAFSARTGFPRDPAENDEDINPKTLIWAAGDSLSKVPDPWKIDTIIDLSYAENSTGRELAVLKKCRYISGYQMFKEQAQSQRVFWKSLLDIEHFN